MFNEPNSGPYLQSAERVIRDDLKQKLDLLIILGTSLKVYGMRKLVKKFAMKVHSNKGFVIFINKTEAGISEWSEVLDYVVVGDCDTWVKELLDHLAPKK